MPHHLFFGAQLDYETAIRADISKQNYSVCPRHWYIDATCRCDRCDALFGFYAEDQQYWYEELRFYVDSFPKQCPQCRADLRRLKGLREEYDRSVKQALASAAPEDDKRRLLEVIRGLDTGSIELPERIRKHRSVIERQLERLSRSDP